MSDEPTVGIFDNQATTDAYHLGKAAGREWEWRLHKHSREMFDVLNDWLNECNHSPESNCVHQRKAQRILDRVRGVKP